MSKQLSELNEYESLQQWLNEHCEGAGHTCWHNYGPADLSCYQSDPIKILLMGAESGGYEGCGEVRPDEYLGWIRTGRKTPRYSSVFVTIIRENIALLLDNKPITPFDRSRWANYYRDCEFLVEKMRSTIYMNARVTSNDTGSSREDKGRIMSDVKEFAPYRKRFIEILKPRIIICAGDSARQSLFNDDGGAFPKLTSETNPVFEINNHLIVMTPHLSRPNGFGGYKTLHEIGVRCANMYAGKDWSGI